MTVTRWIETYSGTQFSLSPVLPSQISIGDIAHSLAHQCRFTGHCSKFYSVAQHSYLCAEIAQAMKLPRRIQRAVFMHDAHEAYIGDVSAPLKQLLPDYRALECEMKLAVQIMFAIDNDVKAKEAIQEIDTRMLLTEQQVLFKQQLDWGIDAKPYDIEIEPWNPETALYYFLSAAQFLEIIT